MHIYTHAIYNHQQINLVVFCTESIHQGLLAQNAILSLVRNKEPVPYSLCITHGLVVRGLARTVFAVDIEDIKSLQVHN